MKNLKTYLLAIALVGSLSLPGFGANAVEQEHPSLGVSLHDEMTVIDFYAPEGKYYSVEGEDVQGNWSRIIGPIKGSDEHFTYDLNEEDDYYEDFRLVVSDSIDVSDTYSSFNPISHLGDTSGRQIEGVVTPEFAAESLPYALMADGANRYKAEAAAVVGYSILSKGDLPKGIAEFINNEKSQMLEDTWTGMRARIYKKLDSDQVVLAFAGTELRPLQSAPWSWRWSDVKRMSYNFMSTSYQAAGGIPEIYEQAQEWTKLLIDVYGKDNVVVTGVSMGGGLAQFSGLMAGSQVYALNSIGLGGGTKEALRSEYGSQEALDVAALNLVTHINVEGESLSEGWLLTYTVERDQLGRIYTVPCYDESLYGTQRHDVTVVVDSLEAVAEQGATK